MLFGNFFGAIAECCRYGYAPFVGIKQAFCRQYFVHFVVVEAFDWAGIDADGGCASEHIGQSDIGLLAAPVEERALVVGNFNIGFLEAFYILPTLFQLLALQAPAFGNAAEERGIVTGIFLARIMTRWLQSSSCDCIPQLKGLSFSLKALFG